MGHQLKLDIYTFSIKEYRSKSQEFLNFEDFFTNSFIRENETPLNLNKEILVKRFIGEFMDTFSNAFVLNDDQTKGIATDYLNPYPSKNIVDGIIKGGLTGINQSIYDKNNPAESEETIDKEKITALPYYFKTWLPFDGAIGVFMVQSYSGIGVNTLILDQFKIFLRNKGFSLTKFKYIPKEFKDAYAKNSKIYKVSFQKSGLSNSAREGLHPVFADKKDLRVKIEIAGFEEDPSVFWSSLGLGKFQSRKIREALEINSDDDFEMIATYKDENGHTSSTKVKKSPDLLPTFYLSDSLKVEGQEYPDYSKISKFTTNLLDEIKKDIEYTPRDVE